MSRLLCSSCRDSILLSMAAMSRSTASTLSTHAGGSMFFTPPPVAPPDMPSSTSSTVAGAEEEDEPRSTSCSNEALPPPLTMFEDGEDGREDRRGKERRQGGFVGRRRVFVSWVMYRREARGEGGGGAGAERETERERERERERGTTMCSNSLFRALERARKRVRVRWACGGKKGVCVDIVVDE